MEVRLKYGVQDQNDTKRKIVTFQDEIKKLKTNLDGLQPIIQDIEKKLQERKSEIEKTKSSLNEVEDNIFSQFCFKIGVDNIRQYEKNDLKTQQDREKKKMDFVNQISRITNQLEYERQHDEKLLSNVQKFDQTVQDNEVR